MFAPNGDAANAGSSNKISIKLHELLRFYNSLTFDFRIFQTPISQFNKGLLFNAGFMEITTRYPGFFQCIVLQDVDILPLNDTISYKCTERPHHLSLYIDRFDFM